MVRVPPPLHVPPLLIVRVATLPFEALAPFGGDRAREAAEEYLGFIEARAREATLLSEALYQAAGEGDSTGRGAARGAVLRIRRAVHQGRTFDEPAIEEAGPLLTPELRMQLLEHRRGAERAEAKRRESCRIYSEEVGRSRRALAETSGVPLFRLGLRLVGRSLHHRAQGLSGLDASRWDPRCRHLGSKLLAYLGRFTTKTSPNGVFCLTALGALTSGPARLRGENRIARMDFLIHVGEARKISACLAASPEALATTKPRPNPTLRREGSGWTLWRPASARRPEDDEVRLQVKDHPVLSMFLDEAASARPSAEELIGQVAARIGKEVRPFHDQLVERGILIAEVEIPWSERRPLRALARRCPDARWARDLHEIEDAVDQLAQDSPEAIVGRMDSLAERLESLPHRRQLAQDDLIRCDASTQLELDLPRALLHDLERLVPLYARLYGALYPEALTRRTFARRFLKRFPPDTDVPLLDLYHGVFDALGAPRPAAFVPPMAGGSGSELLRRAGLAFERARDFFVQRAREAAANGATEVAVTDEDWREITGDAPEPRFSCAVLFQVAASSLDDVNAHRARVCVNAFFPGAGLSVARLSHLHSIAGQEEDRGPITRQLIDGWRRQSRPGALHAEVTFMHGGRTANAGLRPSIFPLEIELPGDCVTEGRERIPLADLTARWDSAAERFVVRSISREVEILPVISSGINPEGFVSFLTMAGSQGIQPLGFFQGFDVPEVPSWPRFTFGNVVLFRRRWIFDAGELPSGRAAEETYVEAQRWRRTHGLPLHVFLHSEGDPKPFYVNLGSEAFIDLLRRIITQAEPSPGNRVHVTEMLPGPDELWVRDSRGRYASEFMVHLDNLDGSGMEEPA
jgi:hypothetical protein